MRPLLLLLLTVTPAAAHDPSLYDNDCCASRDCEPIPDPVTTYMGFRLQNGMWVDKNHTGIRHSRDERFHLCLAYNWRSTTSNPSVRCLYVPDRNF